MPRKPLFNRATRQAILPEIAKLYIQGLTLAAIGKVVGCAKTTVWQAVTEIREEWKARSTESYQARVDRELAKIDLLELEAWKAWEQSKQPGKKTESRVTTHETDKTFTVSSHTDERLPEARFLDRVSWCVEQRCKLLGLYKGPQLAGGSESSGMLLEVTQFRAVLSTMDESQLRALASVQQLIGPSPESPKGIVEGVSDDRPADPAGPQPT